MSNRLFTGNTISVVVKFVILQDDDDDKEVRLGARCVWVHATLHCETE